MIPSLIVLENEMPVFNPEARMIKEFKAIIINDRGSEGDSQGREKRLATKELAFVYFYTDMKSVYRINWDEEEDRTNEIKRALELPRDWIIAPHVQAAIHKYDELQRTPSSKLLISVRIAINSAQRVIKLLEKRLMRMMQQLEDAQEGGDQTEVDDKMARAMADIDAVLKYSKGLTDQLDSLKTHEDKYVKELEVAKGKNQREVNTWQM